MLKVEKNQIQPDIAVLALSGRLTLGRDCQQVEWQLDDLVRENKLKVILDLSGLTYLDSAGIGIVMMCFGKVKKSGGRLRVAGAAGAVEDTLKLTNVDKVIEFFTTAEAAAESFVGQASGRGNASGGASPGPPSS